MPIIINSVLVLPATNATSERSFSKLKLLKTYLRSTMSQARLNHYMIFSVYKEHVDILDLPALAKEFVLSRGAGIGKPAKPTGLA